MNDTVKNRKHGCYVALKEAILTMRLQPGADLDETVLCAEYGLSRTPLRDVFQTLAGEGYVDLRANKGARVSDLSYATLRGFFLAAPMIYGAVLRLAAGNATPAQISDLECAQDRFRQALQDGDSCARALANNAFHEITGQMAHNVYLLPSFKRLLVDHARIGTTFFKRQSAEREQELTAASDQHDAMIDAIRAGDEAAAAALADAHWNLSRHQIERFVNPAPLDIPLGRLDLEYVNGDA